MAVVKRFTKLVFGHFYRVDVIRFIGRTFDVRCRWKYCIAVYVFKTGESPVICVSSDVQTTFYPTKQCSRIVYLIINNKKINKYLLIMNRRLTFRRLHEIKKIGHGNVPDQITDPLYRGAKKRRWVVVVLHAKPKCTFGRPPLNRILNLYFYRLVSGKRRIISTYRLNPKRQRRTV